MSDIKKGDQVQLKSGGQIMTVQELGDYSGASGIANGAKCVWFDKDGVKDRVFDVESLNIRDDL